MKSTTFKISYSKLTIILLLLVTFFAASCKKSNLATGNNTVSFKVDGIAQNYTNVRGSNDGSSYIQVKGSQTSDTTTNELDFYFWTDGPIIKGDAYSFGDVVYNLQYFDASGVLYTITGGEIKYTDESTSHISGTFSGTVKNGSTTKTITDGTFNLNL